jgi:hypothetical protein
MSVPATTSPEWNDYVMKQFTSDELQDGHPRIHGLRRVTELLVGEIQQSESYVKQCPSPENNNRAVVEHYIYVLTPLARVIQVRDVADSDKNNTDKLVSHFPTAVAATRAEARALRKLLKVKEVAAEELTTKNNDENDNDSNTEDKLINNSQVNTINSLAKRLNINVVKFLEGERIDKIDDTSFTMGGNLISKLSKYQKDMDTVPVKLKGYKEDWRN